MSYFGSAVYHIGVGSLLWATTKCFKKKSILYQYTKLKDSYLKHGLATVTLISIHLILSFCTVVGIFLTLDKALQADMNQGAIVSVFIFALALQMLTFESRQDFSPSKFSYLGTALLVPGAMLIGLTDLKAVQDKNFLAIF